MRNDIILTSKKLESPVQVKLVLWEKTSDLREHLISKGEKKKYAKNVAAFFLHKGKYKGKTYRLGEIHLSKKYSKIEYITHEVAHAVRNYTLSDTQDAISYITTMGGYADEMAAYLTGDLNRLIVKSLEKKGWLS